MGTVPWFILFEQKDRFRWYWSYHQSTKNQNCIALLLAEAPKFVKSPFMLALALHHYSYILNFQLLLLVKQQWPFCLSEWKLLSLWWIVVSCSHRVKQTKWHSNLLLLMMSWSVRCRFLICSSCKHKVDHFVFKNISSE